MKTALVCIAKDEDHYIDEWIRYHLKLGFSKIFVYQNNWRYSGNKEYYSTNVEWVDFDGDIMQLRAYNDFIDFRRSEYDFAAFFDCDEFLRLPTNLTLDMFLSKFTRFGGIGINWRLFGDSGLSFDNIEYSVLKRFVKCQISLNRHIKTILNTKMIDNNVHFNTPHCVDRSFDQNFIVDAAMTKFIHGPWNDMPIDCGIQLNHYFCKTLNEFLKCKISRGRADTIDPTCMRSIEDFNMHNFNDMDDYLARDFLYKK